MKVLTLAISLILVFSITLLGQSKKDQKAQQKEKQYQEVLDLVSSKKYEFIGRYAFPQQGNQIDLTTRPNFLRISDTTGKAEMPYFGRAYSGGYSSISTGIKFDGQITDYKIEENAKKLRLTISFRVKEANETYNCIIQAGSFEGATLQVTSTNRQSIRYNGVLKALEGEK